MARKGKVKKLAIEKGIERPVRFRRYEYLFLIVCEDEKTEPNYFNIFRVQIPEETIYLKTVGTGRDPRGVVERTIEERANLASASKKEVDYVWAVFDIDDADKYASRTVRFEEAFEIAEREKIELAYSNEVFELWLLLHLVDVDSAIPLPRRSIYQLLQENIRQTPKYDSFIYEHGKNIPQTLEIILEIGSLGEAITRAEVLLQDQNGRKPIEANPSTRVHLLVQQLLEFIKFFSYRPS